MHKLLSSNLSRLRRDKIFYLTILAMLVYSVVAMNNGCRQAVRDMSEFGYTLDHYYFQFMPFIGLFIAVFASLFLGTEYGDGTIRNKLVVGYTRTQICLAHFLTILIASLFVLAAGFIGGLVGIPALGLWQMGALNLICHILTAVFMTAALCAIFTVICMLSSNKALTAVFCILGWLGLVLLGSNFYNALCEPETYSGMMITAEGDLQMTEPSLNPNYVSGARRLVYEFMSDFTPVSQGIMLADLSVTHPIRMMLCSILICLSTTFCGMFIFKRKDLK